MMAKFSFLFLFSLAGVFSANYAFEVGRRFCRKQVELYQASVREIDEAMTNHADIDTMCNIMVNYCQIAFDTNATCSDHETVRNPEFKNFWTHTEGNIHNVCAGVAPARQCSENLPRRLKRRCIRSISSYNPKLSLDEICVENEEFLNCLKDIALMCSGSPFLVSDDVIWSISGTESAMRPHCFRIDDDTVGTSSEAVNPHDVMQGDAPATTQCSDARAVNPAILACSQARNVENPDMDECEVKHQRVFCMDRASNTCRSALDESIITATRADYHTSCERAFGSCPADILAGESTIVTYCFFQVPQHEDSCRTLEEMWNCVTSLRENCPLVNGVEKTFIDNTASNLEASMIQQCSK